MHNVQLEAGLFRYAMYWRISYGTLRTGLGLFLLKIVDTPLRDITHFLMHHELAGSRLDYIFQKADSFLQIHPMTITHFVAFYLIFWGILDIASSIALLKHQLWAFPLSLSLIAFFIAYEFYRFTHTHSLFLLIAIIVDIAILWLIRQEHINIKARIKAHEQIVASL